MVFNATFNNISVILWQSVLLVEETGEAHRPDASHLQTLSHNVVLSTPPLSTARLELTTLVVIGTDCIGSCKSINCTITTTITPGKIRDVILIKLVHIVNNIVNQNANPLILVLIVFILI